jgi:long-chain fatty acid transport protein
MKSMKQLFKLTPIAALCAVALPALATNGMNMEGYGPISTGMGGASQAMDHGTAAMAQNPATLALMGSSSRMDLAIGFLGPDVTSSMACCGSADSGGTSYVMPALGYASRSGAITWGVGVFAQGGMGTEYGANTFMAGGSGEPVRSELGVGRLIAPIAWQVTPNFALGATIDFVWAGLDLRMAMPGSQMAQLVTGATGGFTDPNFGAGLNNAPWARIDFSDDSDFTGAANSTGWGAKLGMVFKATPEVVLGASYHFKTSLKDMQTKSGGAVMSACMLPPPEEDTSAREQPKALTCSAGNVFTDTGRLTVVDFQWPATAALGVSWQAMPGLLIAADIKRIDWSGVMKNFKMRYDSPTMQGSVSFALPQNWKDQTVTSLGVAYAINGMFTVRGGVNLADNPIPDMYVNPLFPATVKNHYTAGLGVMFSPSSELNLSLTMAPESKVVSGGGVTITHAQTNAQLMYTMRF